MESGDLKQGKNDKVVKTLCEETRIERATEVAPGVLYIVKTELAHKKPE